MHLDQSLSCRICTVMYFEALLSELSDLNLVVSCLYSPLSTMHVDTMKRLFMFQVGEYAASDELSSALAFIPASLSS